MDNPTHNILHDSKKSTAVRFQHDGFRPITDIAENGNSQMITNAPSKLEGIKNWSVSAFKCTRQVMLEKLGKSSRTVDLELESRIEDLRETQKKYLYIMKLAKDLTCYYHNVVKTQQSLSDAFNELSLKSPELQREFATNAEIHRKVSKNGDDLTDALQHFTSALETLCNQTIEDTLLTIRQFETARLEYDAYRVDLESLSQSPNMDGNLNKMEDARVNHQKHKDKYEKLRADVIVKYQLLDENRIKVMREQLKLLHDSVTSFFSGNQSALEATLRKFHVQNKMMETTYSLPSWLEN